MYSSLNFSDLLHHNSFNLEDIHGEWEAFFEPTSLDISDRPATATIN